MKAARTAQIAQTNIYILLKLGQMTLLQIWWQNCNIEPSEENFTNKSRPQYWEFISCATTVQRIDQNLDKQNLRKTLLEGSHVGLHQQK